MATASATKSVDLDGDKLSFNWSIKSASEPTAKPLGDGDNVDVNLTTAGDYTLILTATDSHGASATAETVLHLGNEPAQIEINFAGNQSFYWPTSKTLAYKVSVSDKEDGIVSGRFAWFSHWVGLKAVAAGAAQGHQQADNATVLRN